MSEFPVVLLIFVYCVFKTWFPCVSLSVVRCVSVPLDSASLYSVHVLFSFIKMLHLDPCFLLLPLIYMLHRLTIKV